MRCKLLWLLVSPYADRVYVSGHQYAFKKNFRVCHYIMFTILQLSSVAGIILVIVGGLEHATVQHKYTLLKAGALLQLHAYVGTAIPSLVILFRIKHLPKRIERCLYYATLLAAPFLIERLLYVVLIVFNSNPTFDFVLGNPYVFLGMAVLEEFVIMIFVLGAGLITSGPLSDEMTRIPEKDQLPVKMEQEQVAYQPTVV